MRYSWLAPTVAPARYEPEEGVVKRETAYGLVEGKRYDDTPVRHQEPHPHRRAPTFYRSFQFREVGTSVPAPDSEA